MGDYSVADLAHLKEAIKPHVILTKYVSEMTSIRDSALVLLREGFQRGNIHMSEWMVMFYARQTANSNRRVCTRLNHPSGGGCFSASDCRNRCVCVICSTAGHGAFSRDARGNQWACSWRNKFDHAIELVGRELPSVYDVEACLLELVYHLREGRTLPKHVSPASRQMLQQQELTTPSPSLETKSTEALAPNIKSEWTLNVGDDIQSLLSPTPIRNVSFNFLESDPCETMPLLSLAASTTNEPVTSNKPQSSLSLPFFLPVKPVPLSQPAVTATASAWQIPVMTQRPTTVRMQVHLDGQCNTPLRVCADSIEELRSEIESITSQMLHPSMAFSTVAPDTCARPERRKPLQNDDLWRLQKLSHVYAFVPQCVSLADQRVIMEDSKLSRDTVCRLCGQKLSTDAHNRE